MKFTTRRAAPIALATGLVAMVIIALSSSAAGAATPTDDCSPAAQSAGTCIGFSTDAGTSPVVAAVANQLRLGHVDIARRFVSAVGPHESLATQTLLRRAVTQAGGGQASAAAEQLDAANVPNSVYASPAGTARAEAAAPKPPQAGNGETKAVSLYKWELHGSTNVPVYVGKCSTNGCQTLTVMTYDLQADTYFPADGAQYIAGITPKSGVTNNMTGIKLRLFRDVTHSPDTDEATAPCASSGTRYHCDWRTRSGTTVGHWYYFRLDLTDNPSGGPSSTYQGQTRRYDVINSGNWQFIAYNYGG